MNQTIARPNIIPMNVDRLAEAVGDVQQMHADLRAALHDVTELRTALQREEDRVTLLTEAHDRWRAEALVFRTKLVELSTQMASIGLLTISAQEILKSVNELTAAPAPPQELVTKLEADLALAMQTRTGK